MVLDTLCALGWGSQQAGAQENGQLGEKEATRSTQDQVQGK